MRGNSRTRRFNNEGAGSTFLRAEMPEHGFLRRVATGKGKKTGGKKGKGGERPHLHQDA